MIFRIDRDLWLKIRMVYNDLLTEWSGKMKVYIKNTYGIEGRQNNEIFERALEICCCKIIIYFRKCILEIP